MRRKHETIVLRVELVAPVGATGQDVENYVREAVRVHHMNLPPSVSMFNLENEPVSVVMVERNIKYVNTGNPASKRRAGS